MIDIANVDLKNLTISIPTRSDMLTLDMYDMARIKILFMELEVVRDLSEKYEFSDAEAFELAKEIVAKADEHGICSIEDATQEVLSEHFDIEQEL